MRIEYVNKISEQDFLRQPPKTTLQEIFYETPKMLFKGDNIDVLKFLLNNGFANKVDLVYIDPPFATSNIFTVGHDRVSTISNRKSDTKAYDDHLVGCEFIEFIRLRLILLRELLSEQGSIYLHIDYKIGHYVKIIMDEIFGSKNFRNDITRIKCNPKNFSRKAYGNIKDMILFYSKSTNPIWNDPRESLDEEDIITRFTKIDEKGRYYTTVPIHAPGETQNGATGQMWKNLYPPAGRHWRCAPEELDILDAKGLIEWSKTGNPRRIIYADERISQGKKTQDVWNFKDKQYPLYPTEKNIALLERIINASSNKDSIVMDCFCGSGTTLIAAERLDRKWIGIDQSDVAIKIIEKRLDSELGMFVPEYKKYIFT